MSTTTQTPGYGSWHNMVERCENPKHPSYKNYGARGIKVCDRWRNSFANFIEDMGERPSERHSIDRIDADKSYEPSNCRWATMYEQSADRHRRAGIKVLGVKKVRNRYKASIRIDKKNTHLGYFDTAEEASAVYEAKKKEIEELNARMTYVPKNGPLLEVKFVKKGRQYECLIDGVTVFLPSTVFHQIFEKVYKPLGEE